MTTCVLCRRQNPPKLHQGLCHYCYQEYRAMMNLEREPYRLATCGDPHDLMGFLQFLKQGEIDAYNQVWTSYACIRMLAFERRLPDCSSQAEWLAWKAELIPRPSRYSRAVGHYLAYKGFETDRRNRKIWFEQVIMGETPPQVEGVPEHLRDLLKKYLLDLRINSGGQDCTLDVHGRCLIHFFEWLGQHGADGGLDAVWPEHVSAYLVAFKADGMTQGRKTVPGHVKTAWTMAKRTSVLQSFFAWAIRNRQCSDNPVERFELNRRNRRTDPLPENEIAHLLEIWTQPNTPPREAMIGLMLLVYGLFPRQLLALNCDAVDLTTNQFRGLQVEVPIPPVLRPVLERYLAWRKTKVSKAEEESLVVSWKKGTYSRARPTILEATLRRYGVNPRQLRVTALASTVQHGHLKLLSIFGLTADGMRRYRDISRLADSTRRVAPKPNLW